MNRDYYLPSSWAYARVPETVSPARARVIHSAFTLFHATERMMQDAGKPSKRQVKTSAHKRGGLLHGKVKASCFVIPAGNLPANGRSRTIARYGADGRLIKKVRVYVPRTIKKKDPFRSLRTKDRSFDHIPGALEVRRGPMNSDGEYPHALPPIIDGSVFINTYVMKSQVKRTLPNENLADWNLR